MTCMADIYVTTATAQPRSATATKLLTIYSNLKSQYVQEIGRLKATFMGYLKYIKEISIRQRC